METRESDRYTSSINRSYSLGKSKAFAYGLFGSLIGTVGQFAVIGVLWYGGALVLKGEMSLGTLTSFLLYTLTIAACLGGLSDLFGSLMNALGASQRVFHLLDSRPARPLTGGEIPASFVGKLQLHEVSFSYPSRPDTLVLDRVSLTIQPGSVVALCGSSGSGKSTVIGLIERWYEPSSGSITVDGVPLSLLDGSWWRTQVALVAQEPVLFACSIR
jgi:ATP-binding cassette subfamily B protein